MNTIQIASQNVTVHCHNTVIVGAGAAGLNCAVHLYEFMEQKGIEAPQDRIALVTAGLNLGASRMSGSDKQTYYKLGTSPDTPDSAEDFARTLTAAGCCHGDLALCEAVGSLREFYHLVQLGVPFPHDRAGSYVGYKTDHDPYERATSAGPRTSRIMCERLEEQVRRYGIRIDDQQEVIDLLAGGGADSRRILGVVTIDRRKLSESDYALNIYFCNNLVLAAGGPGELYEASVYPKGQVGIHGIALRTGLAAENLTESQFGLASIKFRWNVSGSYMQVIPRIFSTDANGEGEREFLADLFPTMGKTATNIFLKGYQWPFDPQRIENLQSSLIDLMAFSETKKGRRVFLDFRNNPIGNDGMKGFSVEDLEPEARDYLEKTGALQALPIERLEHMNPLAVQIYRENGIDLHSEPLEIAVCAQHNNGGFAVNEWWESNIPGTFVIGEMAGTHGVKRPGGSALNSGQVGGLRAAEYIVNVYGPDLPHAPENEQAVSQQLDFLVSKLDRFKGAESSLDPKEVIQQIQHRMTVSGGHIRELTDARRAFDEAIELCRTVEKRGLKVTDPRTLITAVQAEHLALASAAYLKAIASLLKLGSGSRGSHLVVDEGGTQIHPHLIDESTGKPLLFKQENKSLRKSVLRIQHDGETPDLFTCDSVAVRSVSPQRDAFETAWRDYREGKVFGV
jgi:succinate dehydrogenase/fumarate reductase flavoprotein subunit